VLLAYLGYQTTLRRQISIIIAYLTTKGIFKVKMFCMEFEASGPVSKSYLNK